MPGIKIAQKKYFHEWLVINFFRLVKPEASNIINKYILIYSQATTTIECYYASFTLQTKQKSKQQLATHTENMLPPFRSSQHPELTFTPICNT